MEDQAVQSVHGPYPITFTWPVEPLRTRFGEMQWSMSGSGAPEARKLWYFGSLLSEPAHLRELKVFRTAPPLLARYRHAKMPPIRRRWYDIPLRASLVATLVAIVVTSSGWVGPKVSGIIALFPAVFTSMMLILHPRIGGPATAAVLANSAWGLIGLGIAIAVLYVAALRFGSAIGLSLALATCVGWNLSLWWLGRRKAVK